MPRPHESLRALASLRVFGSLLLLSLPFWILLPLGLWWLWQEGWWLYWLVAAAVTPLLAYAWMRWAGRTGTPAAMVFARGNGTAGSPATGAPSLPWTDGSSTADNTWSPRDLAAWQEVQEIARRMDPQAITDQDVLLQTAHHTIERVARHYHPEDPDPIWSFTGPELLMLIERVSVRLRWILLDHVPGAHLLEAGHLWRLWEYRPLAEKSWRVARRLHQVWRLARFASPVTALLAEARQVVVQSTLNEAGKVLRSEGGRIWVEEVGRAAIELYSGRLRMDLERLEAMAERDRQDPLAGVDRLPGPIRILVAGPVNAGKSALVNLLLGDDVAGVSPAPLTRRMDAYSLEHAAHPILPLEAILVDTPGWSGSPEGVLLPEQAWNSDLVVWVTHAAQAKERELDRMAVDGIRRHFLRDGRRQIPPILVVLSHIDLLHPSYQWTPPYLDRDPQDTRSKTLAIRQSVEEMAALLRIPAMDVIPMRLDPPELACNEERFWQRLDAHHRAARRGRAQRLQMEMGSADWRKVFQQARGASRLLRRHLFRENGSTPGGR